MANRVPGSDSLPSTTPPCVRLRVERFQLVPPSLLVSRVLGLSCVCPFYGGKDAKRIFASSLHFQKPQLINRGTEFFREGFVGFLKRFEVDRWEIATRIARL